MSVFNLDNTTWKTGRYELFLGEEPALHDSIHVTHPKFFQLYKQQKSVDWSEDEVSLEQSRMDMQTCPDHTRDIMVKNLALQWEMDSMASRSVATLFGPFVTNSEFWGSLLKNQEMEVLHSLTYSEIVRYCIPNTAMVFNEVMNNEQITKRSAPAAEAFNRLQRAGAEYTLGLITKEEAYPIVMMGLLALFCFERLQFMASFACTFAVVEQGFFQGIGKLVQKIMQDERYIHAETGKKALEVELSTERGQRWFSQYRDQIKGLIDCIRDAEYDWRDYILSDGRKCVGLTTVSLTDWIDFNAQDVYDLFGFTGHRVIPANPMKFMDNWLDLNKTQVALQEIDGVNYALNVVRDDVGTDKLTFTRRKF